MSIHIARAHAHTHTHVHMHTYTHIHTHMGRIGREREGREGVGKRWWRGRGRRKKGDHIIHIYKKNKVLSVGWLLSAPG